MRVPILVMRSTPYVYTAINQNEISWKPVAGSARIIVSPALHLNQVQLEPKSSFSGPLRSVVPQHIARVSRLHVRNLLYSTSAHLARVSALSS